MNIKKIARCKSGIQKMKHINLNKAKNIYLALFAFALASGETWAGGYLTNTNQSINFLRNPSRDAAIGIDGVYYNPAGVAFMNEGWHAQFNWQMVHQHRDTWSDYQMPGLGYEHLFTCNKTSPVSEETDYMRKYKGRVNVPIQPSLFLAYNKKDWSFQFGFGFIGGGGACEYADGMASFEYLAGASGISALKSHGLTLADYTESTYLKGQSYDLGVTLGAARKITKGLNAYAGIRTIFAINQYDGYLRDINYTTTKGLDTKVPDYLLDCKQTGCGVAPILGIDYKLNEHWNFAAKYEFRTAITVKSDAHNNDDFDALAGTNAAFAGYVDGAEIRADLPAMLTIGAQYSPIKSLRLNAGYHMYFDKETAQWKDIKLGNTNEFTLGAEYDITDKIQVSGGYQRTVYDQPSDFHSDTSFSLDSYSIGCGIGYQLTKAVKLNVAYFQTIYSKFYQVSPLTTTVGEQTVTIGSKHVNYSRDNRVLGLGVEVNF